MLLIDIYARFRFFLFPRDYVFFCYLGIAPRGLSPPLIVSACSRQPIDYFFFLEDEAAAMRTTSSSIFKYNHNTDIESEYAANHS